MKKTATLAEEIRQTRPFASIEQEAYLGLMLTASQLSHVTDRLLKEHGLTQPQYNVLRILRGAGSSGLCRNEIAARMVTVMPDVTRLLGRLEKAGWIRRTRGQEDRREVSTCITSSGLALLARLDVPVTDQGKGLFRRTGKARLKELVAILAQIRAGLK